MIRSTDRGSAAERHDENHSNGTEAATFHRDARAPRQRRDLHAQSVLDARLGRAPRDVLEATVVLEAWTGRPAQNAMVQRGPLIRPDGPPLRRSADVDPFAAPSRTSVIAEGLTLVLLIVSIAAWATPIQPASWDRKSRARHPRSRCRSPSRSNGVCGAGISGRPHGLASWLGTGIRFWALAFRR